MTLISRTTALGSTDPQLRDRWLDLLTAAHVDLSMAPQWFEATAHSRGAAERAHVFTVYDGDQLVGLIPYLGTTERSAGLNARSRESPGSFLMAYHPEVISLAETGAVLQLYLEDAARCCDVVVLPNLEKDGRTATAAVEAARRLRLACLTRPGHASPFLEINSDWESFLRSKSANFRSNVKRKARKLHDAGAVTNRWFSATAEVEELLAEVLRIEDTSWKIEAGMAISASRMEREYYRLLLPFMAARNALHANVLYLDSTPVAYSLCYVSDGCVRQMKTSFDQRYDQLSPGAVCYELAIRKAFEMGAREFDFLGDSMQHKSLWASGVRQHVSLYLFLPTWRGTLLGGMRRLSGWMRRRS
jgi:CelD/BcsL family acetyltransferase involved in cellulose biosynthesis